ncbi:flavin reductase [Acrocarpospora catenulata]|uniref:flavin reductase n=1 Tax=Acrocarpospora catenulata TaxID=2836182 RepID=UPI001BDA19CF|nr:flavin reductase [Acrocarpospora catenulata]
MTSIDPLWFRSVLGQYPTGVCVITGVDPETGPAGMVVGSFTSVSLDPPLVAFFPDKSSTSWPKIERAGAFCVNILGADQEQVCRTFASKAPDKFTDQPYRLGVTGSPILDGTVAWIDCRIESVQEAGDHYIVLGLVQELQIEQPRLPLLFFQGGYGRFTPLSLAAPDSHGELTRQLRHVDVMRSELESLAADLHCRATATAQVGGEVVIVASSWAGRTPDDRSTLVGQRLPYVPPTGSIFAAWGSDAQIDTWFKAARAVWAQRPGDVAEAMARHRRALAIVRSRGYSLGLLSTGQRAFAELLQSAAADPGAAPPPELFAIVQNLVYDPEELTDEARRAVRQISAPVFDAEGRVTLALTAYAFHRPETGIEEYIERVREAAGTATKLIGGQAPGA